MARQSNAAAAPRPVQAPPLPRTVVHATDEVVDVRSWARGYVRDVLELAGWRVRPEGAPDASGQPSAPEAA